MSKVKSVPIAKIRENPVALRTVNRKSEEYLGLIASMKEKGFLGAITGRAKNDEDTSEEYFEIIDGLHRYSAAKDAGLESINIDVHDMADSDVLEAQIMTNVHKVETRPVQYSKQLQRLLTLSPLMTEAELAAKLGKSPAWIAQRLGLNNIDNTTVKTLVDDGKIPLSNAYGLAKLPPEEMAEYSDRAQTMAPDEFLPIVNGRVKEIRDAKRKGKDAPDAEFQPTAHLQKLTEIKEELDTGEIGDALCVGLTDAVEGFAMGIRWVLHLDPKSVEVQRAKDDQRKADREAAKQKRMKEAAEKKDIKAKKAAEEAEKAKAELAELEGATAGDKATDPAEATA